MSALHILNKSTHGPHDEERAILRAMSMAEGLAAPLPVWFGKKVIAEVGWDRVSNSVWAAPFNSYDDMINKLTLTTPQNFSTFIQKRCITTVTANVWFDLWPIAGGDPDAGTYPGAASTAYVHKPSTDPGFPSVGPALSAGQTRHIVGIDHVSASPGGSWPFDYILYDRVLVYNACPIINGTTTMTNSVPATRYSGAGVQLMVTSQVALGGAVNMTALSYKNTVPSTNSLLGVPYALDAGTTATSSLQSTVSGGTPRQPWLPLTAGDNGVQIINSFTTDAAQTGSVCFVLAKPICTFGTPIDGQYLQYDLTRSQCNLAPLAADACLSLLGRTNQGIKFSVGVNVQIAWG